MKVFEHSFKDSSRIVLNGVVNYCTTIWCFSKASDAAFDGKLDPFLWCCFVLRASLQRPELVLQKQQVLLPDARQILCAANKGCFSVRHLCSFLSSEVRLPDTNESRASEWLIPRQSRQHAGLQHRSAAPPPSLTGTTAVQCYGWKRKTQNKNATWRKHKENNHRKWCEMLNTAPICWLVTT